MEGGDVTRYIPPSSAAITEAPQHGGYGLDVRPNSPPLTPSPSSPPIPHPPQLQPGAQPAPIHPTPCSPSTQSTHRENPAGTQTL